MKVNLPKFLFILLCTFLMTESFAQGNSAQNNPWADVTESAIQKDQQVRMIIPNLYRTTSLDLDQVTQILDQAPWRFNEKTGDQATFLQMPHPEKGFMTFQIWYAPVMHPDLAAKYPEIRSFVGQGVEDPSAIVRFDLTPHGFHAMIRSGSESTIFIDPYANGDNQNYISYFKKNYEKAGGSTFFCEFDEYNKKALAEEPAFDGTQKINGDCDLHTYRLALACTGEYAQFHGGTVPLVLAAMNTSMTRVNGIFENDATVTMQLVPNNDQLIFLDGATDPYSNGNGGAMLSQNQTTCNNIIGSSNYDIGHVFSTGGGGVASLESVCTSSKARGVTGQGTPVGDPFDVDYVAHEIGHQFGGRHTQNNSCNRDGSSSYEPGSASTIMGYAGICNPNVQNNSDDYFHINSIIRMTNWSNGGGSGCANITNTGNNAPVSNAGSNYTIPASTPFVMEGIGTDADGDALTYCWEQYDNQVANMPPQSTNTTGPAFRSLDPTSSPDRYLPNLNDLVNNVDPTWEELASVSRSYTWRLTVRDNNPGAGCTDDDESIVTVDGSVGPFVVTAPNAPVVWEADDTEMVTWNVAGTTGGNVNAANVDIFLSTDGGFTYPITLALNTPNDGSHNITVPNNATTQARIMVRGSGNIFFDISNQNFIINGLPEDYELTVLPPFLSVCDPAPATFDVNIESIGGFTGPVTLSATNVPTGAEIAFTPNPVIAPGMSNMLVINNGIAPGNYVINVVANGTPGMQEQAVSLTILPNSPAPVALLTPANEEENVVLMPVFGWNSSANALSYSIQVADNSDFVDPVIDETGIMNTVFPSPIELEEGTKYFWRVLAANECGDSGYGEPFNFTTAGGNPLSIQVSGTDISCFGENDGTASVTVSGGSGNYTYLWNIGDETATITDLEPGEYFVDVSDGIQTLMGSVTIEEPAEIIITGNVTDAQNGNDGAIDVEVMGGTSPYTYLWSNGEETQDLTGLIPGEYTVSVTDFDGCQAMATFMVGPLPCDPWLSTVSMETPYSVAISWTPAANASLHKVRYRIAGTTDPWLSKSGPAALNSFVIDGLLPLTTYEYNTKTKCIDGSSSDWSSDTYFFTTLDDSGVCDAWLADMITVTETSATVDWTAEPGATSYRLIYRPITGGPFERVQTTATTVTLEDLTPGTTYELKGKSLCPDGWSPWSEYQNFLTDSPLQFYEDESTNAPVKQLELFPNPVQENLEVRIYLETPAQLLIQDYTGKVVWQAIVKDQTEIINVRNLPTGIYLLSLQGQDGTIQTERFIKSN